MIYLLSFFLLTIVLVCLWLICDINRLIFWIMVPLVIFTAGFSWITFESLSGWPHKDYPPNEAAFLGASIQKPSIFVMAQPSGSETPRLYVIPYTDENEKKVSNAEEKRKSGGRVRTKNSDGEFRFYEFNIQEVLKK